MKLYEKKIEAVCDCGASVSCLGPLIYDELKQTHKLDLKPWSEETQSSKRFTH